MYNRSELIEPLDTNKLYIYDAIDSTTFNQKYILSLLTVCLDRTKFTINVSIDSVFFDIKLYSEDDLKKYDNEFESESYEKIYRQPFDSTEKFTFLRLYYNTLKKKREALKKIETKREEILLERIEEFDRYYDTYSDNQTCYYRTVAYKNDFELVK
ncbi:16178_t:CDS:1 [Cetraspora pellucida]|uniref:16178_t:CDS:1 n=1 Tax=Cetraspora pellucida TaxID=1433469 RepID=A0A9N9K672_9GLOM|nr:16178_t:CDS:1 [Cetraspora pellucida]